MSKTLKRSELIKNRFKIVSQNGELILRDELEIIQHLFNKLHLVPISEAARRKGISYNAMKSRVKANSEMFITVGDLVLVEVPEQIK